MVPLETIFGKKEPRVPDERELIGLRVSATQAHTLSNRNTEAITLFKERLEAVDKRLELLERPAVDLTEPGRILATALKDSVGEVSLAVIDLTAKLESRSAEHAKQIGSAITHLYALATESETLRAQIETLRIKTEDDTALQEERKRNDGLHHQLRDSLDRSLGHLEVRFTALEQSLGVALKTSIETTAELNREVLSLSGRLFILESRPVVTLEPAMDAIRVLSALIQAQGEQMDRHMNDFADGLAGAEEHINTLLKRTWWSLFKEWIAFWRKK